MSEHTKITNAETNKLKVGPNEYVNRSMNVSLVLINPAQAFDGDSEGAIVYHTGHPVKVNDVIRITSNNHIHREFSVVKVSANYFVLSYSFLDSDPITSGTTYNHYRTITQVLDSSGQVQYTEGQTKVVDFWDLGSFAPTGGNAIPASGGTPMQLVSSLAAAVTRIQNVSDVGEFVNLYDDVAGLPANLIAHMVLTPDEMVDVDLAAGSSIYVRAAKNTAIDQPNSIMSANLIGAV